MKNNRQVATITFNPAIDQAVSVPNFTQNSVNRVESIHSHVGGKGINVASNLARCGHKVLATGFLGLENKRAFMYHFANLGIADAFEKVEGSSRTNIKIIDPGNKEITDLNFPGFTVRENDHSAVINRLDALADGTPDWLCLCGSLPPGLFEGAYADLIKWAKNNNCKTVLDTSGAPFNLALACKPHVVKPNIHELEDALKRPLTSLPDVRDAARELVTQGIGLAAVSMGEEGSVFCSEHGCVHAVGKPLSLASTVGAGDAMVSGILHAQLQGYSLARTATTATAFSLACLAELGPYLPEISAIDGLEQTVTLTDLS
ncbi:1-phosphofructokinase [Flexibacterium corallicola]|uniref:1-phosphofructokinase n=1 Tax=Flexibacterium corallicola TaxID=3037259 RepID=UPI00286EF3AB|nr:1-phosphofructokinase [Pseudovibrio sp. M1P-2-3]